MTTSAPVPALDRDMIARLRADIIASSWTTDTLDELLSDGALSALMRDSRLPALVELVGVDAPPATLTRFFFGGVSQTPPSPWFYLIKHCIDVGLKLVIRIVVEDVIFHISVKQIVH